MTYIYMRYSRNRIIIDLLYPVSIYWSQTHKNVTIILSEKDVLIKSITSRSSWVKWWVKLCHFWCNICQGHKHKIDISFDLMNASQCRKIHKNEQKRCIWYKCSNHVWFSISFLASQGKLLVAYRLVVTIYFTKTLASAFSKVE